MTDIDGRATFTTGGSNGIGLGITRALPKNGRQGGDPDADAAALSNAVKELRSLTEAHAASRWMCETATGTPARRCSWSASHNFTR